MLGTYILVSASKVETNSSVHIKRVWSDDFDVQESDVTYQCYVENKKSLSCCCIRNICFTLRPKKTQGNSDKFFFSQKKMDRTIQVLKTYQRLLSNCIWLRSQQHRSCYHWSPNTLAISPLLLFHFPPPRHYLSCRLTNWRSTSITFLSFQTLPSKILLKIYFFITPPSSFSTYMSYIIFLNSPQLIHQSLHAAHCLYHPHNSSAQKRRSSDSKHHMSEDFTTAALFHVESLICKGVWLFQKMCCMRPVAACVCILK